MAVPAGPGGSPMPPSREWDPRQAHASSTSACPDCQQGMAEQLSSRMARASSPTSSLCLWAPPGRGLHVLDAVC